MTKLNIALTALGEALKIAQQLSNFPQNCMRQDRRSAYYAMYDATSFKDAVSYELIHGVEILQQESVKGECLHTLVLDSQDHKSQN